jgi:hypothetical protein
MTSIQERKKCSRCKVNLLFKEFKPKRNGTLTKRCIKCLDYGKKWEQKSKDKYKCEHNRRKYKCKECGGASTCIHNKQKTYCKECGGSSICIHNREKYRCKECGGSQICIHNRQKTHCKECGGSCICIHNRQKSHCKECGGGSICIHNKHKTICKECDPQGHLSHIVRNRIQSALQSDKSKHSIEYLGCSIQHFKEHIEKQFTEGMTWDNYGEWHIDHIIPLKYENPTIEETIERLHWENTQPLWATDNKAKGNRYIG